MYAWKCKWSTAAAANEKKTNVELTWSNEMLAIPNYFEDIDTHIDVDVNLQLLHWKGRIVIHNFVPNTQPVAA